MAPHSRPSEGFAYLWLLFAVAFMGVGLAVVAEVHAVAQQRDKERELLAIGHQFREALRRYQARSGPTAGGPVGGATGTVPGQGMAGVGAGVGALPAGQYPASLDELLQDPRTPGVTRHLRQVFVDPMTGKAEWGLVRVGGRVVGVHSLSERRPVKQAGFEDQDMAFAGQARYRDWVFTHPANLMATLPAGQGAQTGQVGQIGQAGQGASAASAATTPLKGLP